MTSPELFGIDRPARVSAAITLEELLSKLRMYRLPVSDEIGCHDALQLIFERHDIRFQREHVLGEAFGRIDFFLPEQRTGLEVKVRGSVSDVTRQLLRYAQCPAIERLVLVTGRTRLGQLPATLAGKSVSVVTIWEGLL